MLLVGVDDDQITLTERQLSPTAVDDDACATEAEQELGGVVAVPVRAPALLESHAVEADRHVVLRTQKALERRR